MVRKSFSDFGGLLPALLRLYPGQTSSTELSLSISSDSCSMYIA